MSAAVGEISVPDELGEGHRGLFLRGQICLRRAFEALVSEAYRSGSITHTQVSNMLELDPLANGRTF